MRSPWWGNGSGRRERRRRLARGRGGEWRAALWLRLRGYRILYRRLRTPVGELDLVAVRGGVLAVVEVKRRPDPEAARAALGPIQRRRIEAAARWLLAVRPDLAGLRLRFDLVAVPARGLPRHLPDAWRPEGSSPA